MPSNTGRSVSLAPDRIRQRFVAATAAQVRGMRERQLGQEAGRLHLVGTMLALRRGGDPSDPVIRRIPRSIARRLSPESMMFMIGSSTPSVLTMHFL